MQKQSVVDLFCGCGGISEGLRNAGFKILAGVDIEKNFLQTYRENFSEAESLECDLAKTAPEELLERWKLRPGQLDVLAGGPPCQGFSKNVPRNRRFMDLPNNLLIRTFLRYCDVFRPKAILLENVAEMKNGFHQAYTQEIIDRLMDWEYEVIHAVMNAADFGVPQRRRRAFFLATERGTFPHFPDPTHATSSNRNLWKIPHHISVWEAIGDLPSLKHGEGQEPCEYVSPANSEFQRRVRNSNNQAMNHIARKLAPLQYKRLASLEPGQGHKDLPEPLQVKGGYSGAYGRLTKDMVAPTITRWVFHPGSGRFGHPVDIRTITMREAARIQGFPDSFVFVGSYNQQAGQLGNAAPPLLVEQIATKIFSMNT